MCRAASKKIVKSLSETSPTASSWFDFSLVVRAITKSWSLTKLSGFLKSNEYKLFSLKHVDSMAGLRNFPNFLEEYH